MTLHIRSALLLCTAALLALPACGDDAEAKQLRDDAGELRDSAQKTMESLGSWTAARWREFTAASQDRFAKLQDDFEAVKENTGKEVDENLKAAYEKAQEQMQRLQSAGKDAWKDASEASKKALDELQEQIAAAKGD